MRTAKVTTNKGETWSTSINGTDESICDYFLGKQFNRGTFEYDHERDCEIEIDDMQTVIKVEIDGKEYRPLIFTLGKYWYWYGRTDHTGEPILDPVKSGECSIVVQPDQWFKVVQGQDLIEQNNALEYWRKKGVAN